MSNKMVWQSAEIVGITARVLIFKPFMIESDVSRSYQDNIALNSAWRQQLREFVRRGHERQSLPLRPTYPLYFFGVYDKPVDQAYTKWGPR